MNKLISLHMMLYDFLWHGNQGDDWRENTILMMVQIWKGSFEESEDIRIYPTFKLFLNNHSLITYYIHKNLVSTIRDLDKINILLTYLLKKVTTDKIS